MAREHSRAQAFVDARCRRALNNLMGILQGVMCDGQLTIEEIGYLSRWLEEHAYVTGEYPANVIARKVKEVLSDNVITADEQQHLLVCLQSFVTGRQPEIESPPAHIARLFDDDPSVIFAGRVFVLTGDFLFGPRSSCERAVLQRGGRVTDAVSGRTDYVVLGSRSSPAWIEESFGRKLQKAAELIDSGESEIAVIREADWVIALDKRA